MKKCIAFMMIITVIILGGCGARGAEKIDAVQYAVTDYLAPPTDEVVYTSDPDTVKAVADFFGGLDCEEYAQYDDFCDEIGEYVGGIQTRFVDLISDGVAVKRYAIYGSHIQLEPHGQVYTMGEGELDAANELLAGLRSDPEGVPPVDLDVPKDCELARADSVRVTSAFQVRSHTSDGAVRELRDNEKVHDITDSAGIEALAALFSRLEYMDYAGSAELLAEMDNYQENTLEFMSGGECLARYDVIRCSAYLFVDLGDGEYKVLTDAAQNYWLDQYLVGVALS